MPEDVADRRDFRPWNFRPSRFYFARKMTAGLGNNLKATLNEPALLPILFEGLHVDALDHAT
jgi:hypothetical protein